MPPCCRHKSQHSSRSTSRKATYADLTRSYDATKALHTRIFDQLKTTELQYELERASATARYEIITPPRLEYVSVVKTFVKRAGAAMVAGFALGMVIAAAFQIRRLAASWQSSST